MSFVSPTPLVNPLHFALGDSAAGSVRAACDSCGMPGAVIGFSNDLAAGPLDDSQARDPGLRGFLGGGGEAAIDGDARLSQWRAVLGRLEREPPEAVILWGGDNVAEVIFVAMACDRLAGRPERLLRVQVPGIEGRPYVAMHSPEQLARLYATRRPLSGADRRVLAQDFARIRDTCGPVRRLESGRVVGVPGDYYDHLLLAACGPHWQAAGPVVGTAMAHCDGPNLMGDGFFSARLSVLIEAGRIEASGPRTALREYRVRLAPTRQG
ncbi:DUF3658 domain-containing protein [uncultured Thiodictyon sp.]|jgi:hypothetical protein|uniref:DUF3658 domain-containing protein n=1 Tax=uncultured Thiodictyon sp. TaxID=1846217 RepID=UPI0025F3248B|nr:DUF3658 domain-containing protein [uncultured Thiodictyon sp.]